jgi:hypothetical protein
MRARRGAAFTLVSLALAAGAPACGGHAGKPSTSPAEAKLAAARWRTGLARWHRSMMGALDSISVLFATENALASLRSERSAGSLELSRDEEALAGCTREVGRLGPAPEELAPARRYALEACAELERGEKLVEAALHEVRTRPSLDPLAAASGPLSTAQNELGSVETALATAER